MFSKGRSILKKLSILKLINCGLYYHAKYHWLSIQFNPMSFAGVTIKITTKKQFKTGLYAGM